MPNIFEKAWLDVRAKHGFAAPSLAPIVDNDDDDQDDDIGGHQPALERALAAVANRKSKQIISRVSASGQSDRGRIGRHGCGVSQLYFLD